MTPITLAVGAELLRRLSAKGYRPILVGGLAIEAAGFGGTKDVDAFVRVEEFDAIEFLKGEGFHVISSAGWITNGQLTLPDGTRIPFDILNPRKYVGPRHTGVELYAYVERTATKARYGLVATPGVVYYTRLLVEGPHGESYIERIRRDLEGGAPTDWLRDALKIAAEFGTESKVKPKVNRILREFTQ